MTRRAGFTLIELVVVIMILGILAGVAAPRLFSTSATATDNGIKQSLAIVRDAIELYAANNGGTLPQPATGALLRTDLTPYIRGTFPICPVGPNKDNDITIVAGAVLPSTVADGNGWKYSTGTGAFILNNSAASSFTTPYDQF